MTDERINIKIAELCGWKIFSHCNNLWAPPRRVVEYECDAYPTPNYAGDLNACHEFEKAKLTTISLVTDYGIRLANIMHRDHNHHPRIADTGWKIPVVGNCSWCATARQRCEAFLRVHNQWEEEA